jgi:hypothetical protein
MTPVVRAALLNLVQDANEEERVFSYARTGVSNMTIRSSFKVA